MSVAEETGLSLALSETPKAGFVATRPNYNSAISGVKPTYLALFIKKMVAPDPVVYVLTLGTLSSFLIFIPPANFVCRGYTVFTLSVRPSETFCFLNNSKSHRWIFIKPCKHVHICKTNTLDKKVRARGQFYQSYFPL